jgi:hypothetical protein
MCTIITRCSTTAVRFTACMRLRHEREPCQPFIPACIFDWLYGYHAQSDALTAVHYNQCAAASACVLNKNHANHSFRRASLIVTCTVIMRTSACWQYHNSALLHVYVSIMRLLHIGRIRMDIDNSGVTWDLDKTTTRHQRGML